MNVQIYAFFPVVCICSPFFEKHCPTFYFFNIWNIQYPHADVFSRQTWTTGTIPVGNAFPNCVVPVVLVVVKNTHMDTPSREHWQFHTEIHFERFLLPFQGAGYGDANNPGCHSPRICPVHLPWAMFLLPLRGVLVLLLLR